MTDAVILRVEDDSGDGAPPRRAFQPNGNRDLRTPLSCDACAETVRWLGRSRLLVSEPPPHRAAP